MTITDPMRSAYAWLASKGGYGVLDRRGRVIAAGELAARIESSTWLRLVVLGALRGDAGVLIIARPGLSLDEIARL